MILIDDFNSGLNKAWWKLKGPSASWRNGYVQLSNNAFAQDGFLTLSVPVHLNNFNCEFDAWSNGRGDTFGLFFGNYMILCGGWNYGKDGSSSIINKVVLRQMNDFSNEIIIDLGFNPQDSTWHRYKFSNRGGHITFYIDNMLWLDQKVSDFAPDAGGLLEIWGRSGLAYTGVHHMDNFFVNTVFWQTVNGGRRGLRRRTHHDLRDSAGLQYNLGGSTPREFGSDLYDDFSSNDLSKWQQSDDVVAASVVDGVADVQQTAGHGTEFDGLRSVSKFSGDTYIEADMSLMSGAEIWLAIAPGVRAGFSANSLWLQGSGINISKGYVYDLSTFYTFRLEVSGMVVRLYVDGVWQLQGTMSSALASIWRLKIYTYVSTGTPSHGRFDNVRCGLLLR